MPHSRRDRSRRRPTERWLPGISNRVHAVTAIRCTGKTTFTRQLIAARRREAGLERALYLNFDDDRLADIAADQTVIPFKSWERVGTAMVLRTEHASG